MDLFMVLQLLCGLALFLFGMNSMGDGLESLSGGKLEKTLEKMTNSTMKGFILGAAVTAVIQSSSATTVMVVGFVNSGIMKLRQAIGIIMGANVGTTITSWILSLSGIEGDSLVMQLLKPSSFSAVFAFVGIILLMFCNSEKKKHLGTIFLGFGILMVGMDQMSAAVEPLSDDPTFTGFLTLFNNPVFGILAGALLTAVIQSSSASVGILQALSKTGAISYSMAIPIVMGQNIGTCVTALISCIGAKKNAKRAAFVHLYFNIIGTVVFMVLFYAINAVVQFPFMNQAANAAGIAVVHTTFNVFATLLLLPFSKVLEKLAILTIRDKEEDKKETEATGMELLDSRFLDKPALAVEQSRRVAVEMANKVKDAINTSIGLIEHYDSEKAEQVLAEEEQVDCYEDGLGTYLVKLSQKDLNVKDSHDLSIMLHCIGDFERISDHAVSIMRSAKELYEKNLKFSDEALAELKVITKAVEDVVEAAVKGFETKDESIARSVEPIEEVIDELKIELKNRHVRRLRNGNCTIEQGFVLSDITASLERVADHCSNVAVCICQVQEDAFDTHSYLEKMKKNSVEFQSITRVARARYALPSCISVKN